MLGKRTEHFKPAEGAKNHKLRNEEGKTKNCFKHVNQKQTRCVGVSKKSRPKPKNTEAVR